MIDNKQWFYDTALLCLWNLCEYNLIDGLLDRISQGDLKGSDRLYTPVRMLLFPN